MSLITLRKIKGVMNLKFIILTKRKLILVSCFSECVTLKKFVDNQELSQSSINKMFKSIVKIIKRIHHHKIAHRDIKLENILIHRNTRKITIIDFGFSSSFSCSNSFYKIPRLGSMFYMAPENFDNRKINRIHFISFSSRL